MVNSPVSHCKIRFTPDQMERFFFKTSYFGKNYHGWQVQENAVSIQETLENCLSKLQGKPASITGSGRTDTGVHARGQIFHADLEGDIDTSTLLYKLNSFLPADISILEIRQVIPEANARFDAISRTYEYHLHTRKDPFLTDTSYYFRQTLNLDKMNQAAQTLFSHRDFEAFSRVKTQVNHFLCEISVAEWQQVDDHYVFTITANRFLRGMVRAIVGTLLEIGRDKMELDEFEKIILSKDRTNAGRAVPAHGLYFMTAEYPPEIFLQQNT